MGITPGEWVVCLRSFWIPRSVPHEETLSPLLPPPWEMGTLFSGETESHQLRTQAHHIMKGQLKAREFLSELCTELWDPLLLPCPALSPPGARCRCPWVRDWQTTTNGPHPLPMFANKVLLKHSHMHLFMDCLWLFLFYNRRAEQLQQTPSGLPSLKYLLSGSCRKIFAYHCSRAK